MFIDTREAKTAFSQMISLPQRIRSAFAQWTAQYLLACEVAEERRVLARLDPEILSDLGITREAARAEARRRFWDLEGVLRFARK